MSGQITIALQPGMNKILGNIALMLVDGLTKLNVDCKIWSEEKIPEGVKAIVLGANFYASDELLKLSRNSIIFNVENASSIFITEDYIRALRNFHVWDYSASNARLLEKILGRPVRNVKLFHGDSMNRIVHADVKDIDVLFFGSFNERRAAVLEDLRERGLNVCAVFNVYGDELDALIARSKVVLNLHYYDNGHLEVVRLLDLLANHCAIVTESSPDDVEEEDLLEAMVSAPYQELADAAEALVHDEARRRALAQAGAAALKRRAPETILRGALEESEAPVLPSEAIVGSGKAFDARFLNIDIDPRWNPDIVADITDPKLFEPIYPSQRFGFLRLERGAFDRIGVSHVLEHLPDLVAAMTNLLEMLAVGGELRIAVPYDLSYGAWQDPTHVRAFNERSWLYYCDWHWYIGWTECRFDVASQEYGLSSIGRTLAEQGVPEDVILRTPRAVDEMKVVLKKRRLSPDERAHGRAMRGETRPTPEFEPGQA